MVNLTIALGETLDTIIAGVTQYGAAVRASAPRFVRQECGGIKMRDTLTTSNVAELLGVAVASVSKWIDGGALRAGRTPGGHRRVAIADLLKFLQNHELPIPEELQDHNRPKLLIVGASRLQCRTLGTKIRRRLPNLRVFDASDEAMASAIIEHEHPDAAIIDLSADEDRGVELCRCIKSLQAGKSISIIALVRADSQFAKAHTLPCGKSTILIKPIVAAKLAIAVAAAIGLENGPTAELPHGSSPTKSCQGYEGSEVSLSLT